MRPVRRTARRCRETRNHVAHGQLQLLDGEGARVTEADDSATAVDELIEILQIRSRQLVGVFRAGRRRRSAAATAAGWCARNRHARVVGHDQHVDFLRQRGLEVLGMDRTSVKPYCSSTQRDQPSSMLPVHGWYKPTRGWRIARPGADSARSAWSDNDRTMSSCAAAASPRTV